MMIRWILLPLLSTLPQWGWGAEATPPPPDQPDLAAHTLVVYNRADPDSQPLAEFYAKARSIQIGRAHV